MSMTILIKCGISLNSLAFFTKYAVKAYGAAKWVESHSETAKSNGPCNLQWF